MVWFLRDKFVLPQLMTSTDDEGYCFDSNFCVKKYFQPFLGNSYHKKCHLSIMTCVWNSIPVQEFRFHVIRNSARWVVPLSRIWEWNWLRAGSVRWIEARTAIYAVWFKSPIIRWTLNFNFKWFIRCTTLILEEWISWTHSSYWSEDQQQQIPVAVWWVGLLHPDYEFVNSLHRTKWWCCVESILHLYHTTLVHPLALSVLWETKASVPDDRWISSLSLLSLCSLVAIQKYRSL